MRRSLLTPQTCAELSVGLLPDRYDDWLIADRERHHHLRLHALEALCERLSRAGRYGEGMRPHAGTDGFTVRLPLPEVSEPSVPPSRGSAGTHGRGKEHPRNPTETRMGFGVDVVGYSDRGAPGRETLQTRLDRLVRDVLDDIGFDLANLEHQRNGDGMNVVLPLDTDITQALPGLINAMGARLRHDNERHDDRMRLRMACDVGTFKAGANGADGLTTGRPATTGPSVFVFIRE